LKSLVEKLYFMLAFAEMTGVIPRIFGEGGSTADAAVGHTTNPVLFAFVALFAAMTVYYTCPRLMRIWRMLMQLKWIFLVYAWMVLTVLWTETPSITFFGALRMILYLLSAAFFALRYDVEENLRILCRFFVVTAVLSFAAQYLLPQVAQDDGAGWGGIFPHKNWLGFSMMAAIGCTLARRKMRKPYQAASLLLFAVLLLLSQSFTAIVATAVTVLFVTARSIASRSRAVMLVTMAGVFFIVLSIANPLGLLLAIGGKSTNFTGRAAVWAFSLEGIAERPVLGHGYAAFWSDSGWTLEALHWSPPHAHNGLLQVSLDLGLTGLVFTLGVLYNMFRRAQRVQRYDRSAAAGWIFVLLVMAFVHNLTEADLMLFDLLWYLIVAGSFSLLLIENAARSRMLLEGNLEASEAEQLTA